jgi:glycosyltransferase involved in cell wall biosynthesis
VLRGRGKSRNGSRRVGRRLNSFLRVWRSDGLVAAVRASRWRLAGRVGRVLVGGDLTRLEGRLADAEGERRLLQARFADLVAMMVGVRDRALAAEHELAALRAEVARIDAGSAATARLDARLDAVAADLHAARRLAAAVGELGVAQRSTRDTVEWLERTAHAMRDSTTRHGRSIAWLARRHMSASLPPACVEGPLVSVVLPTWNRAALVTRAIASVQAQRYPRWELLVVDDGSTDDTAAVLAGYASDGRIRVVRQEHGGQARARNRGVAESGGDVIAYLDSDNAWDPGYLDAVVAAFADPAVQTAYLAQLVHDRTAGDSFLRGEPFDAAALRDGNFIDLNVFAHRRALVQRFGGFDESLARLVDWDMILRYTAAPDTAPAVVPIVGGEYEFGLPDQVSTRVSYSHNLYWIWRKLERPVSRPVRALFALWHYPQLSESYVRVEVAYMKRLGVDVTVWRSEPPAAAFDSEVPVLDGDLADVIADLKPHVVHVHWLDQALNFRDTVAASGVPLTVRGHGFEFAPERLAALDADPAVHGIYLFPHLVPRGLRPGSKIRSMVSAFEPDRYRPSARKDPRLVVRAGAAIPTKDLDGFIRIAARCPEHRFVLAVCRAVRLEGFVEELRRINAAHGDPVDLRVDLQHDEVAALLADAGIYLHTHGLTAPYGMPVSIAEAMATGAYVVARACPASADYVGDAGRCWSTEDEAVELIRETETWSDARWEAARLASVERAFARHADLRVLPPLLEQWVAIAGAQDA